MSYFPYDRQTGTCSMEEQQKEHRNRVIPNYDLLRPLANEVMEHPSDRATL